MYLARVYLALFSVLLLGYAFLDRGFAYLGFAPVYVGEITLMAGLFVALLGRLSSAILRSPIVWAILAYATWGALTTISSIGALGLEALRNSVIWSYSVFALLAAGLVLKTASIERSIDWYGRWMPWFVLWTPVGFIIAQTYAGAIPNLPGTEVNLMTLKSGDFAVHLAGAAAFLSLGLNRWFPKREGWLRRFNEYLCWSALCVGVIVTGSRSRAALSTVLIALVLVMTFKPINRMSRVLLPATLIVLIFLVFNIELPIGGGRFVSPDQIVKNIESTFFGVSHRELMNTAEWRIDWWKTIINYTMFGDYFWTGKGYVVNLAADDGFVTVGGANRSPHNGHLTVLARSGVPGLILWIVLHTTILIALLRRYIQAITAGLTLLANVNLWLMTYWTAFMVNMSFDVYLEGPQGGIWFWSLIGYVVALTLSQDALVKRGSTAMAAPSVAPG